MSAGNDRLNFLIRILAIAFAVVCPFLCGVQCGRNLVEKDIVEKVDTMYVRDTIVQYEPILEERIVIKKEYVPVVQQDTIWSQDTLYVAMDREQVVWQDSLSRVYASGIFPQIDSVEHYITERIVTKEVTMQVKKPCRWGVGVQVGYGVQFGEQVRTAPYIGVGVSYNLLSW